MPTLVEQSRGSRRNLVRMSPFYQLSRTPCALRTAARGHEEQFSPPTLSARYVIRQETSAGVRGKGRNAPKPAVRGVAIMALAMSRLRNQSVIAA